MSSRFYVIPYFLNINYTKYYTSSESMVIIYIPPESATERDILGVFSEQSNGKKHVLNKDIQTYKCPICLILIFCITERMKDLKR